MEVSVIVGRRIFIEKILVLKTLQFSSFSGAATGPATLLKKILLHRCFPVNFAKFLRSPDFTERLRMTAISFCAIIFIQLESSNNGLSISISIW